MTEYIFSTAWTARSPVQSSPHPPAATLHSFIYYPLPDTLHFGWGDCLFTRRGLLLFWEGGALQHRTATTAQDIITDDRNNQPWMVVVRSIVAKQENLTILPGKEFTWFIHGRLLLHHRLLISSCSEIKCHISSFYAFHVVIKYSLVVIFCISPPLFGVKWEAHTSSASPLV